MVLVYLLISIMPLERHPLFEKVVGEATLIKYLGLLCVAYALTYLAVRRTSPSFLATPQARVFVVYIPITFLSFWLIGSKFSLESNPFLTYLCMFFLFIIIVSVVDSLPRLRVTLLVAVGGVAFGSIYVIREWQKNGFAAGYRPGWVVGDPNYFGVSVLIALPIAVELFREPKRPFWQKAYCLGCMGIIILGLVGGESRGAFLGLIGEITWILWHSRNRAKNFALMAALLIPPLLLAPSSPLKRFIHPSVSTQSSTQNHIELLKGGLRMIAHHPLVGVGLGNFRFRVLAYSNLRHAFIAHNAYIEVGGEMGVPMLILYLLIIYFSLRTLGYVRQRASEPILTMGAEGVEAGLIGASIAQCFVSGEYQKLYWLMIFLSMAMHTLVQPAQEDASLVERLRRRSNRGWVAARQDLTGVGPGAKAQRDTWRRREDGTPGKALPARR